MSAADPNPAHRRSGVLWPSVTLALPAAFAVLEWSLRWLGHPIDLSTVNYSHRGLIYSALAGTAGGLLGLVLATLAILLALPDRPIIKKLRGFSGWRSLEYTLLASALDLFLTLVLSLVALGWDSGALGLLAPAEAVGAGLGILLSGCMFALIVAIFERDAHQASGAGDRS